RNRAAAGLGQRAKAPHQRRRVLCAPQSFDVSNRRLRPLAGPEVAIPLFNPELETATRDRLAAYQLERARGLIDLAMVKSPFYGHKFRAAGLENADEIT